MSATAAASIDGLLFDPPAGFRRERTTATLRVAPESGLPEAALGAPVRPSLVVERRPAPRGKGLAACVAEVEADLLRTLPGIRGVDAADVHFTDGVVGVVLAYSFPAPRKADVVLCQLQALRLDGETLSALTLTTTLAHLTETRRDQLLRILASARLIAAGPSKPDDDRRVP